MATYPIKMLRDEDRQPFVPFTNAAAVVDTDNNSLQELMDNGKYKIQNNVTTSSAGKGVLDAYQGKVLNDKFNNYVPLSQKGVANGVATLDAEGKVPSAQLPSYVDDVIESYIVSGSTALSAGWLSKTDGGTALTPEKGKIYLIMTSGSYQNKQYRWGGSTYVLCNPSDVNSVNGMTGVVTLKKLTIQKNGTQVGETFNGSADKVINITVPTNNNQLTNGAGYITAAGHVASATKATQDGNGNVIVDTYVKKAGDTMSGKLQINYNATSTSTDSSNLILNTGGNSNAVGLEFRRGGASWQIVDESGALVFRNNYTDSAQATYSVGALKLNHNGVAATFYTGVNPDTNNTKNLGTSSLKWANVYATTFQGNATSATKATQDGNGKVIASTYLPLAGGTMTGAIKLHGLVAQTVAGNTDINTLIDGIYHTETDGNSSTMTNLPSPQSQGLVVITPYNATNDNRTVQLSLNSNGNIYYRTLRTSYNSDLSWSTVVTSKNSTSYKSGGTKAALTIQKNGTTVGSTFDGSTARTINITVPTKVTDLTDNTNYVKKTDYASASAAGVVKLGTGLAIADGVLSVTGAATADSVEWSVVKNRPTAVSYWTNDAGYIKASNTMKGATATTAGSAGTVPAPAAGKEAQFLRGDGTWAVPSYATSAGSATTIGSATVGSTTRPVYIASGTPTACAQVASGKYTGAVPFISTDGVMEIGSHIDFHTNTSTKDFDVRLYTNGTNLYSTAHLVPNTTTQTLGLSSSPWANVYATTFTGKVQYIDKTGSTFLTVGSDNKDTTLLRVYSSDSANSADAPTASADFGYSLVYKGTGNENNNALVLYSDNQNGTQVAAMTMLQGGSITLGATLSTKDIFASKHIYLNGVASSSLDTTTKIIFGNASTTYGTITANTGGAIMFNKTLNSNSVAIGYIGQHNAFAPGYGNSTATLGCNTSDAKYQWANVYTKTVDLGYAAQVTYNSTDKCIEFNFS